MKANYSKNTNKPTQNIFQDENGEVVKIEYLNFDERLIDKLLAYYSDDGFWNEDTVNYIKMFQKAKKSYSQLDPYTGDSIKFTCNYDGTYNVIVENNHYEMS